MKSIKKYRLNSKGFSHVELLIVLIMLAAIAGVGFFVYSHHNKAHAAGWTTLSFVSSTAESGSGAGISAIACQTEVNSTFEVQIEAINSNSSLPTLTETVFAPSASTKTGYAQASTNSNSGWASNSQDSSVAVDSNDVLGISVSSTSNSGANGYFNNASQSTNPSASTNIYIVPSELITCNAATSPSALAKTLRPVIVTASNNNQNIDLSLGQVLEVKLTNVYWPSAPPSGDTETSSTWWQNWNSSNTLVLRPSDTGTMSEESGSYAQFQKTSYRYINGTTIQSYLGSSSGTSTITATSQSDSVCASSIACPSLVQENKFSINVSVGCPVNSSAACPEN
jgi:hypothetical protein